MTGKKECEYCAGTGVQLKFLNVIPYRRLNPPSPCPKCQGIGVATPPAASGTKLQTQA